MASFWVMREHLETYEKRGDYCTSGKFVFLNSRELTFALREFYRSLPGRLPFNQRLPQNFPRAQIKMPSEPFFPDYFTNNSFHFVSAKLRQAMGSDLLEEEAIQFFPLQSIEGNEDAVAQDYNLMHIRSAKFAIDIEKSDLKTEEKISAKTQEPYLHLFDIEKLTLREDILSKPELFMVKEIPSVMMVSDNLAQRVLKAGCTGITFYEPASAYNYFTGVRRYKTLEGIGPVEK